jgi:hypothetical protein
LIGIATTGAVHPFDTGDIFDASNGIQSSPAISPEHSNKSGKREQSARLNTFEVDRLPGFGVS